MAASGSHYKVPGRCSTGVTSRRAVLGLLTWILLGMPVSRVNAQPAANLEVGLTDAPDPLPALQAVHYALTETNYGPGVAGNVIVEQHLPETARFVNAIPPTGAVTFSDRILTWTLSSIQAGTSATCDVWAQTLHSGTLYSTASVSSGETDPVTSNNVAVQATQVNPSANVTVEIWDAPDPVLLDGLLTLGVTLRNNGELHTGATTATVSLPYTIPPTEDFVSSLPLTGELALNYSSQLVFTCPDIPPGETAFYAFCVQPRVTTVVSHPVAVECATPEGDRNDNSAQAQTTVIRLCDLSVQHTAVTVPAYNGRPLTYSFAVRNDGPSIASAGTQVYLDYTGSQFISASMTSGTAGWPSCSGSVCRETFTLNAPLHVGEMVTGTLMIRPTGSGTRFTTATVWSSATDPEPANNTSILTTTVERSADISVGIYDSPDPVIIGSPLQYVITANNSGPDYVTSLTLTDVLPPSVSIVSTTTSLGTLSVSGNTVTVFVAERQWSWIQARITVVPFAAGTITNQAQVSSGVHDPDLSDRLDQEDTLVKLPTNLGVTLTGLPDRLLNGQETSFTATVRNTGPGEATQARVSGWLPPALDLVSVATSQGSVYASGSQYYSWYIGTIPVGGMTTAVVSARANAAGTACTTATASSYETDTNPSNNSASTCVSIFPAADITVTKTDWPDPVHVGDDVIYVVGVANKGPDPATSVTLVDTLPTEADFVSTTCTQGGFTLSGHSLVWDVGSLGAGTDSMATVTMRTVTTTTLVNAASAFSEIDDPTPDDNTALQYTMVTSGADLVVEKTAHPSPARIDADLVYVLRATNRGPDIATSVTLVDDLPDTVDFVSVACSQGTCKLNGRILTFAIDTLTTYATATAEVLVIPRQLGVVQNSASVQGAQFDPLPDSNQTTLVLEVREQYITEQDDDFTAVDVQPPGSFTGWSVLGAVVAGRTDAIHDAQQGALSAWVSPSQYSWGDYRIIGWQSNQSEWLPYSAVGSDLYVRVKYFMFASPHTNLREIPNFRLRASSRFAVNAMLEVFHHLDEDYNTSAALCRSELRPSMDPTSPSLYRVDFDPFDVPYLARHADTEGIMRAFEAYAAYPQEQGTIEMTESSIGTYPACILPDSDTPLKVYQTSASDAGDLKLDTYGWLSTYRANYWGGYPLPADPMYDIRHIESSDGVTLDSTLMPSTQVGLASREFSPGAVRATRVRVEEGKQYKVRWRITSSTNANTNPQLRLRASTVRWGWSTKYEIGGAFGTNGLPNTAIAQQSLPGVGTQILQKLPEGNGAWYNVLVHSPMCIDIRGDMTGDLATRMPNLSSLPGPGIEANSYRDISLGFDLIDTLSNGYSNWRESGNFRVERIEVLAYDLIDD